ncbi:MAG TPA: hypothetical protein VH988_15110 [Thermoanaerobaculia bacterium]|jgi:hypothetical protein|nr:hypothetical protein [Thermoanaerobaculia bacterium]
MQLESVRELKASLQDTVLTTLTEAPRVRALGVAAGQVARIERPPVARTLALGIVPGPRDDYRLAVRIQRRALEGGDAVESIRRSARGEVDVRYIGRVVKRADQAQLSPLQGRLRPLRIGGSIGHFKITAGTLGSFVRSRADSATLILSNNHVLANENRAKKGDLILQPGHFDQGMAPADVVGSLASFVRLKRSGNNLLDCAAAKINQGIEFDFQGLDSVGRLTGLSDELLREGQMVHKVGRTTGVTRGRVTAIEMDNVLIDYDLGTLRFDQQIEIEGADDVAFSAGGDSGSVIVDDTGRAVALLFAGGDQGGENGKGLTYANPLRPVLEAMKVDLIF